MQSLNIGMSGTIGCWNNVRNIRVSEQRGVGIAVCTRLPFTNSDRAVSSVTNSVPFAYLYLWNSGGKRLNMMNRYIKLSNQSVCRDRMGVNTGLWRVCKLMDRYISLSYQSVCRNRMGVNTGLIDGSVNVIRSNWVLKNLIVYKVRSRC